MASKLRRPPLFSYSDGSVCLSSYPQYTACKVSELLHNIWAVLGSLACCHSELIRSNESYRQVVRLFGRGSALCKAATYTGHTQKNRIYACPRVGVECVCGGGYKAINESSFGQN